ncbi:MAG: hypothetical protein ACRCSG_09755 [Cellulosilyticaceae bacterium]
MKKNYLFLTVGIILSLISKVLQFSFKNKIGDVIVVIAAIFFTLAIAFSYNKFNIYFKNNKKEAIKLLASSILVVMSFQIMMILLIGNKKAIGFIFLIPLIVTGVISIRGWIYIAKK